MFYEKKVMRCVKDYSFYDVEATKKTRRYIVFGKYVWGIYDGLAIDDGLILSKNLAIFSTMYNGHGYEDKDGVTRILSNGQNTCDTCFTYGKDK